MTPVYANGLLDKVYWQMMEKRMSVLATFNSLGIDWTLEKNLKFDVKFARFRPIHGSSYIALPSKMPTVENCSTLRTIKSEIASGIALWRLITCIIK